MLAVPHEAAARLIPPGALPDATVAGWAGLGASPIVNVHVIYDRPVMDLPFAAAVDSPVQWVFDRTRISGLRPRPASAGAQYLAISLSAAEEYVDVPAAALREQFVPALAELFPAAREAQVTEFFVTRERRATFRQAPGTARLRPRGRPRAARPGPGGRVDRDRMARHHGERRPQRPGRRDRAPPHGTLRARTSRAGHSRPDIPTPDIPPGLPTPDIPIPYFPVLKRTHRPQR